MWYDHMLQSENKQLREMIPPEKIRKAVSSLAARIEEDFAGHKEGLVMICVLKGAAPFFTDLIRELHNIPLITEFVFASSYHGNTVSSGDVDIRLMLSRDLCGKDIFIVEDIIDTGESISKLISLLKKQNPASISVAAFLHKITCPDGLIREKVYSCFDINDCFVVGYGMDWKELYRNLPGVYYLADPGT